MSAGTTRAARTLALAISLPITLLAALYAPLVAEYPRDLWQGGTSFWDAVFGALTRPDYAVGPSSVHAQQADVYAANRVGITVHIVAIAPLFLLGPVQLSDAFRRRWRRTHRLTGRIYIALLTISLLGSTQYLLATPLSQTYSGTIFGIGLWTVTVFAVITHGAGILAIMRRDVATHRHWMALGFATLLVTLLQRLQWIVVGSLASDLTQIQVNLWIEASLGIGVYTLAALWLASIPRPKVGGHDRSPAPPVRLALPCSLAGCGWLATGTIASAYNSLPWMLALAAATTSLAVATSTRQPARSWPFALGLAASVATLVTWPTTGPDSYAALGRYFFGAVATCTLALCAASKLRGVDTTFLIASARWVLTGLAMIIPAELGFRLAGVDPSLAAHLAMVAASGSGIVISHVVRIRANGEAKARSSHGRVSSPLRPKVLSSTRPARSSAAEGTPP